MGQHRYFVALAIHMQRNQLAHVDLLSHTKLKGPWHPHDRWEPGIHKGCHYISAIIGGSLASAGTYPSCQRCCAASAPHSGKTKGEGMPLHFPITWALIEQLSCS